MNGLNKLLICLCLLISTAVSAEQKYPTLYLPNPSSPAVATFLAWHDSLLKNDFVAFKKVSFWIPTSKEDLKKQLFDQLRINVPSTVKITEQKTNPNGSVSFYAVGCKDARRLINNVNVANTNGKWQVAASGWGPPWNETVKLCPV